MHEMVRAACRIYPTSKEEVSAVEESGILPMDNPPPVVVEDPLSFYRNKDGSEIALSIQAKSILYPLEIRPYSETQRSAWLPLICRRGSCSGGAGRKNIALATGQGDGTG